MGDQSKYSTSFEPVLLEGLTATLYGAGIPSEGMNVVCKAVGALPEYQKDFGALTGGTTSPAQQDTNLNMGPMELTQLRMRVIDDIQVKLSNPASVQQWRTLNTQFYLPRFPAGQGEDWLKQFFFRASELFVFENNNPPAFDLLSPTATITKSRILFSGWRFKLEKIKTPGRVQIWINAWPATGVSSNRQ